MHRRKHKKHKKQKRDKDTENGITDEKLMASTIHKDMGINGKTRNSILEVVSTEESEDEKLVDLDSDEVDCTIIEDDIDLEELMKQKVRIVPLCRCVSQRSQHVDIIRDIGIELYDAFSTYEFLMIVCLRVGTFASVFSTMCLGRVGKGR